jgi:hypothetical protein
MNTTSATDIRTDTRNVTHRCGHAIVVAIVRHAGRAPAVVFLDGKDLSRLTRCPRCRGALPIGLSPDEVDGMLADGWS